ncbi:putative protein with domain in Tre-2, BUB2p, and Cdc16p [Lyophyllum shimeji]|uniref:Rab-GAP TBC domain-containing protein n=1 Tax=Lyophyllum shimeji TaxID=47721 RepID=A0A9P3PK41_LYOSH|nr:putative protein with domain in Tre-2, BUB2p, and Cdc16p [Lyophyllum shimeji]
MEAAELARWTRFAGKGGIGKCTAINDCVAENVDDLMFMKDDEITVLMQLPHPPGMYLGYCEGVVGRFNGSDVHFHSKLKKPVMAKRSSVNSSTSKSPTPKAPSPMAKADSPVPTQPRRIRVSLDEQVSASIAVFTSPSSQASSASEREPIATADPGVSRSGKSRGSYGLAGPREEQVEKDVNGTTSPSIAISAPSMFRTASASSHHSSASRSTLVESPLPISPPRSQTRTTSASANELPSYTLPSSTAHVRSSFASSQRTSVLSSYSQATATEDDVVLSPIVEDATSATTPSRASPSPPPPPSHPTSPPVSAPASTTTPSAPSTAVPDTSTSTYFDTSRISLALSDGEVGIGLSLLQDLAEGASNDEWSDSDSDGDVRRRPSRKGSKRETITQPGGASSLPGPAGGSSGEEGGGRVGAWRTSVRASVVSEESRYSHASSDEGLGYEDTETGNSTIHDELEADISQTQEAFRNLDPASTSSSLRGSPTQMTFPPVAPLSPSRTRFPHVALRPLQPAKGEDYEYEFPPVPTHTPGLSRSLSVSGSQRGSLSGALTNPFPNNAPSASVLNPHTSNASANSDRDADTPPPPPPFALSERRPSLAPSTTSMSAASVTTATSSDWDGGADIYDDYRYSRFSMGAASGRTRTSFASSKRVSVSSRFGGAGGGGAGGGEWPPPFVDDPQARERADSMSGGVGRPSMDSQASISAMPVPSVRTRSRSNTNASLGPIPPLTSPPPAGSPPPPPPPLPREPPSRPFVASTASHERTESVGRSESDASSVYTQTSAQPSPNLDGAFPIAGPRSSLGLNPNSDSKSSLAGNRPAPLNLVPHPSQRQSQDALLTGGVRSPLLHTTWGSPASSPQPQVTTHPSTTANLNVPVNLNNTTALQSSPLSASSDASNTGYTGTGEGFRVGGGMPASATYFPGAHVAAGRKEAFGGARRGLGGREMGRRIVVEDDDDDEVVIGHDVSRSTERGRDREEDGDVSVETLGGQGVLHEAPSLASSPEPEPALLAKGRLGPRLVVASRSPSSSSAEDEKERPNLADELPARLPSPVRVATSPPPITLNLPTPSSSPAPAPAPSHLRPTLHELRPAGQGQRQSLFLPHPNAPKAPAAHSPGPMYVAQQQPPPHVHAYAHQSHRGGALQTIRMALAGQGPPQGPRGRGPTIYGFTAEDLSSAIGPVLMQFSVNPPPATAPPGKSLPPPAIQQQPQGPAPGSMPTPAVKVVPGGREGSSLQVVAPVPVQAVRRVGSLASLDAAARDHAQVERPSSGAGGVIPRANFFPKAAGARPRSRSFSGFQNTTAEIPLPIQRSGQDGKQSLEMPSASDIKRALSPIVQSPTTPSTGNTAGGKISPLKSSPLRSSSPFAHPHDNSVKHFKPPSSPLAQSFSTGFVSTPSSPTQNRPAQQLRQMPSRSTLNEALPARASPQAHPTLPGASNSDTPSPTAQQPQRSLPELRGRPSVDADGASVHSNRSNLVSPPPTLGRQNSLRSKLSLPNLKRSAGRQDEIPDSPVIDTGDTVQVKDTDFELVRPNIGQLQAARASEDSGVMGREGSTDARHDPAFLRADSPAGSLTAPHSPTVVSDSSGVWQPLKSSGAESESSMDAHRQREQKWMAVLGSVPAAQARKNKKVKKLLFDGVPSSVRYLVWSHLTDGKARCVPGVYSQLQGRERVPALADVDRDVRRCFVDHPQLQSTQGPVLSLMQAYLTMVPDIQYMTGLTLISGHLLLLAPEEDAFWIFVSVMDTHIRPYFSSTATQIDVDASLFSRALESIDPAVAKKMFTDLAISPVNLCRPWFTSLFVGCLPSDFLNRVWDIFLFEGVPFLFRVALALVSCCRRPVLESTSEDAVLNTILRPSPALLPPGPDALIALALAVKLKDDDIRKQRVKLEAQVKRQTQAPRMVSTPAAISLPRT